MNEEKRYRADVVTEIGIFTLDILPGTYSENEQLPYEVWLFEMVRADVLRGGYQYGWTPYQDPTTTAPNLLSIEPGANVKAFRLYEKPPVGVESFSADAVPAPASPYPFTAFGEYLGNKLTITGVTFKTPTTEYLLPVYVNDKPATEFMKPAPLSQQLQLAKETEGLAPTDYVIVIPDVWLDMPQAAEYLAAYVQDAEPQTKVEGAGKAAAWPGWNEK